MQRGGAQDVSTPEKVNNMPNRTHLQSLQSEVLPVSLRDTQTANLVCRIKIL